MYDVCAFSGHRVLRKDFDEQLLYNVTEDLIKTGTDTFLCGMARGFDMKAAECVLSFKDKYEIKLVACIPCADQAEKFTRSERNRYEEILGKCDEVIVLSEGYFDGCMQARDRYMVENCNVLVCYLRETRGGTFYTANYAKTIDKKIINL